MWNEISQWCHQWRDTQPFSFWVFVIGCAVSVMWIISFFQFLRYAFSSSELSKMIQKYGRGSYAIITGCTEGIGKAFAEELASLGFNLILISRNNSKLDSLKSSINKRIPSCLIEIYAADFTTDVELSQFKVLADKFSHLDVSLLVNNVGVDSIERFDEVPEKTIIDLMNINLYPLTFLSREILAKMSKRGEGKQSSMITISSQAGLLPMHHFNVYSGTKAFGDMLSRCLAREYKSSHLSFLSVCPSKVSTHMNNYKPEDIFTVSAADCARGALSDLLRGYSRTEGALKHKLQALLIRTIPRVFQFVWEFRELHVIRKERGLPRAKIYFDQ